MASKQPLFDPPSSSNHTLSSLLSKASMRPHPRVMWTQGSFPIPCRPPNPPYSEPLHPKQQAFLGSSLLTMGSTHHSS